MRIGYGWDSHEFKRGVPLMIGGVRLPYGKGLKGHSDGDVLLHALTDALLGAVAAGDIGSYFPPSDPRWKGANSAIFLRAALRQVHRAGYEVANIDSTLILDAPKIGPHAGRIQASVARLLGVERDRVGIKAKTPEGMGTDNAAIAHVAVLLLKKENASGKLKKRRLKKDESTQDQNIMNKFLALIILLLLSGNALAQSPPATNCAASDAWATPAEKSCYRTTPRYDQTMAYVHRVAAAAPAQVRIETFGKTPEGRDLVVVIASGDGVFDPARLRQSGRPIVLIQNAIHAGEMDGKDSCLALLRDMVVNKSRADLLRRAVVLIIPIYNADGHERFGPYNRINQNGPEQMGWRAQSQNLNLNRDYLKAQAPETRYFLKMWNRWLPDFFVDDHVTDGADFQYDVTYALDTGPDVDPALARWQEQVLAPYMEKSVTQAGHLIFPYVNLVDDNDLSKGLKNVQESARFSTGYTVLQNRPGMLVEMHMLKDYKTRVTGNYEILRALLEVVNRDGDKLVAMNRAADAATVAAGKTSQARFPLQVEASATEPVQFLGYKYNITPSEISGAPWIQYTREPMTITVPRQTALRVTRTIAPPRAYIVPAEWTSVIDVLAAHGLRLERTTSAWTGEVDTYRCTAQWQPQPFEGRHVIAGAGEFSVRPASESMCQPARATMTFPAGSVVVPLDQRAAKVAIHWLEPEGPDSAVVWGFFDSIFEQKEYGESYVLEKLAREMLARDPKLGAEFEARLAADAKFAGSPQDRLNFFYQRSPWADPRLGLYPVGRLSSLQGLPISSAP